MTPADLLQQLEQTAATAVHPLGLLVEQVQVIPAGRRRLVRVSLDRDLAGIRPDDHTSLVPPVSLDEIADASRGLDEALDGSGLMGEQAYVLEVSSVGVGRPLAEPRHFRRNVGRLVELDRGDGKPLLGRIQSAGTESLTLGLVAQRTGRAASVTLSYADVRRATVQVEFAGSAGSAGSSGDAADEGGGEEPPEGEVEPQPGSEED